MKIYPRKFQSGGQLNPVGYYPSVQYIPTSSVAITQGAWQPFTYAKTADSIIDPELVNKVKGHSNDAQDFFNRLNQNTIEYNNMSEAERRSIHGKNQLARIRETQSELNSLINYQKATNEAFDTAKKQDSVNNLARDSKGNAIVRYKDEKGKDRVGLVNPTLAINDPKYTWVNNAEAAMLRDRHPDLVGQDITAGLVGSTGKTIYDKNLYDSLTKIGSTEFARKSESEYGLKGDGLYKAVTQGVKTFSNNNQIALVADLAESHMSQADRAGIESDALLALKNNNDSLTYIVKENGKFVPKPLSIPEYRQNLQNLKAEADKTGDYSKLDEATKTFTNLYRKSYLQSFFDARKENKISTEQSNKVLDTETAKGLNDGNLYSSLATHDSAAAINAFNTDKLETVQTSGTAKLLTRGIARQLQVDPSNPSSSNIVDAGKKGSSFLAPISNDPKVNNYTTSGKRTLGGLPLEEFSQETKDNTFRVGTNEFMTNSFFTKRQDGGGINLVQEGTYNKTDKEKVEATVDIISREAQLLVRNGKLSKEEAQIFIEDKLKKKGIIEAPVYGARVISLVDVESKNPADRALLSEERKRLGLGTVDNLTEPEKEQLAATLFKRNNPTSSKPEIVEAMFSSYKPDSKGYVKVNDKTYKIVLTNVVGVMSNSAMIHSVSQDLLGQKPSVTVPVNISNPTDVNQRIDAKFNELMQTTYEDGGIIPQFNPIKIDIRPMSLNDLY